MISLRESLRELISLSQGAPELKIYDFRKEIINEINQSEPGGSRALNEWLC